MPTSCTAGKLGWSSVMRYGLNVFRFFAAVFVRNWKMALLCQSNELDFVNELTYSPDKRYHCDVITLTICQNLHGELTFHKTKHGQLTPNYLFGAFIYSTPPKGMIREGDVLAS